MLGLKEELSHLIWLVIFIPRQVHGGRKNYPNQLCFRVNPTTWSSPLFPGDFFFFYMNVNLRRFDDKWFLPLLLSHMWTDQHSDLGWKSLGKKKSWPVWHPIFILPQALGYINFPTYSEKPTKINALKITLMGGSYRKSTSKRLWYGQSKHMLLGKKKIKTKYWPVIRW